MVNTGIKTLFAILLGASACNDGPERYSIHLLDGGVPAPMEDASDGGDDTDSSRAPEDAGDGAAEDAAGFDAGPFHPICDGTLALKFGARVVGTLRGSLPELMSRLGISYIYVRGDCSYWSNRSVGSFATTHSGVLTAEEEHELSLDFGYGNWDGLRASYGGAGGTSHTLFELFDSKRRVLCAEEGCGPYGPDMNRTLVSRLEPSYYAWLKRMETLGTESTGSQVRALAFRVDAQTIAFANMNGYLLAWTPIWSLNALEGPLDAVGVLIDGNRAADLRGLRTKYVSNGGIVVPGAVRPASEFALQEGGATGPAYYLWFRDVLPFENVDGVIPFEASP
jgi:hypothetical protein